MRALVDRLTRELLDTRKGLAHEFSRDIQASLRNALKRCNVDRQSAGLAPIPADEYEDYEGQLTGFDE